MVRPLDPDVLEARRKRRAIERELAKIRRLLEAVPGLYERRLELWNEAQQLQPRILQRELAELSGVTEEAVVQAFRKARRNAASEG